MQLKKLTAGPDWFDLPAPPEADLPRLHREVEALRLRNQLDPKRFYKKEEGEGKGIKGLPKYFAVRFRFPSFAYILSCNPSRSALLSIPRHHSTLPHPKILPVRKGSAPSSMNLSKTKNPGVTQRKNSTSYKPFGEAVAVVPSRPEKPRGEGSGSLFSSSAYVCVR